MCLNSNGDRGEALETAVNDALSLIIYHNIRQLTPICLHKSVDIRVITSISNTTV